MARHFFVNRTAQPSIDQNYLEKYAEQTKDRGEYLIKYAQERRDKFMAEKEKIDEDESEHRDENTVEEADGGTIEA